MIMAMSRDEVVEVAKITARETVAETFRALGIDTSDPFAVQRDMAHLRFWRKIWESAIGKIAAAAMVGIFAVGVFLAVRVGVH